MPARPPKHRPLRLPSRHERPATARGYGWTWQKLRLVVLAEEPICRRCRRALAAHVDHIVPKGAGGTDACDNLQGLCAPCHADKTVHEDGGLGRGRNQKSEVRGRKSEVI